MRTRESIQAAIDTAVSQSFQTTETFIDHGETSSRILTQYLHTSDMEIISALVKAIDILNPDRNVFWMISAKELYRDEHIEALGMAERESSPVAMDIFISYQYN